MSRSSPQSPERGLNVVFTVRPSAAAIGHRFEQIPPSLHRRGRRWTERASRRRVAYRRVSRALEAATIAAARARSGWAVTVVALLVSVVVVADILVLADSSSALMGLNPRTPQEALLSAPSTHAYTRDYRRHTFAWICRFLCPQVDAVNPPGKEGSTVRVRQRAFRGDTNGHLAAAGDGDGSFGCEHAHGSVTTRSRSRTRRRKRYARYTTIATLTTMPAAFQKLGRRTSS
jgi:hypothetical protein